jgi:hypothetical protein
MKTNPVTKTPSREAKLGVMDDGASETSKEAEVGVTDDAGDEMYEEASVTGKNDSQENAEAGVISTPATVATTMVGVATIAIASANSMIAMEDMDNKK